MKKARYILIVAIVMSLMPSCVDDYQDANPPRALDGPYFILSAAGDVVVTPNDGNFIGAGQTIDFTLHVIDCPGGIDSVGVTVDEDSTGTGAVDQASLSAVMGESQGQVLVHFTTVAEVTEEIDLEISVTLYDGQQPIEWHGSTIDYRKSSVVPYDVTLISCSSTGLAGEYNSLANGFFGDGAGGPDAPYDDLAADITITEIRPGLYEIDDMSFGLYPILYGDIPVPGQVDLCGFDISDRGDTDHYGDPFTITGTLNGDGTVNLTWQNTYGDRGTVVLTPI